MSGGLALFDTAWVHVFEEDGPEGAVFRPESGDLPLSRRPRQRLTLSPDGSAWLTLAGPDDRLQSIEGRWREERGELVVRAESAGGPRRTLHVRVAAADRLLVRR